MVAKRMMGRTGGKELRNGERKRRREKGKFVAKEKEGRRYREKYRRRKKKERPIDRAETRCTKKPEVQSEREIDKKVKWHGERRGMGEEEAKKLRKKGKGRAQIERGMG